MEQAKVHKIHGDFAVAREVAEAEFERFGDAMDLDFETSRMDADELKRFDEAKYIVVRAIQQGSLVIDDSGQPIYTSRAGDTITFYEPTGATYMSMDSKKREQEVAKMFGLMAEMTRQPEKLFAKMPQRDLKVCRTLSTLFLG